MGATAPADDTTPSPDSNTLSDEERLAKLVELADLLDPQVKTVLNRAERRKRARAGRRQHGRVVHEKKRYLAEREARGKGPASAPGAPLENDAAPAGAAE